MAVFLIGLTDDGLRYAPPILRAMNFAMAILRSLVDTLFPSTIIFDFSASCVKRIEPSIIERLIVGK
ncbi:hypothetical protein, partial [Nitrosospira sp. Nsp1]|uniref:hypothetical protein n=1 Tax=Nitrosospira sp. Nsp1 TaxID=136547 RepID=UPI00088A472E